MIIPPQEEVAVAPVVAEFHPAAHGGTLLEVPVALSEASLESVQEAVRAVAVGFARTTSS